MESAYERTHPDFTLIGFFTTYLNECNPTDSIWVPFHR